MKKNISTSILFLLLIVVAGCAGSPTPIPNGNSADAAVYKDKCSLCHSLPHPARANFAGWQSLVTVMEKRMAEKKMAPLNKEERRSIFAYLKQNSR